MTSRILILGKTVKIDLHNFYNSTKENLVNGTKIDGKIIKTSYLDICESMREIIRRAFFSSDN